MQRCHAKRCLLRSCWLVLLERERARWRWTLIGGIQYNTIQAQECLSVIFMYVTEVSCLARAL